MPKSSAPSCANRKVATVMREYKGGKLHAGTGRGIVKGRSQAVAIALSEARRRCGTGSVARKK